MSPSGVSRDQSYIKHLASWMAPRCQVDPSDAIHRDSQGVNIYSFSAVEKKMTPKNRELPFYTVSLVCQYHLKHLVCRFLGNRPSLIILKRLHLFQPCLSEVSGDDKCAFLNVNVKTLGSRDLRNSQGSIPFFGFRFGRCRCKKDTGLPDANLEGAVCRAQGPSSGVRHLRMSRIPIHRDKHRQSWLESLEILQRARMSLTFLFHCEIKMSTPLDSWMGANILVTSLAA